MESKQMTTKEALNVLGLISIPDRNKLRDAFETKLNEATKHGIVNFEKYNKLIDANNVIVKHMKSSVSTDEAMCPTIPGIVNEALKYYSKKSIDKMKCAVAHVVVDIAYDINTDIDDIRSVVRFVKSQPKNKETAKTAVKSFLGWLEKTMTE